MTALEIFYTLIGNNLLSIGLGLVSWALPLIYLFVRKRREAFTCGSLLCVVFSLYFQLREVMRLTGKGDWSSIEDTINAVVFAATTLITVTLILNIIAWCKKRS